MGRERRATGWADGGCDGNDLMARFRSGSQGREVDWMADSFCSAQEGTITTRLLIKSIHYNYLSLATNPLDIQFELRLSVYWNVTQCSPVQQIAGIAVLLSEKEQGDSDRSNATATPNTD